jgi:hypothetical protein
MRGRESPREQAIDYPAGESPEARASQLPKSPGLLSPPEESKKQRSEVTIMAASSRTMLLSGYTPSGDIRRI